MESQLPRKLDTQMPEAANALHGDQISTAQAGVAKSVVGRDTRAEVAYDSKMSGTRNRS
jgi:hypothetical protein